MPDFPVASSLLFDDYHAIAVNKPSGWLTQAPAHLPSIEAAVKAFIKERESKPAGVYLGVPHRLDRPVSGVLIFARNTKAAQRLHAQFAAKTAKKIYWAWVEGDVVAPTGPWEDWLKKVPEEARTVPAEPDEPGAKLASLGVTIAGRKPGRTLLELAPATGRMHQLRVQCAWRGHPILGDADYGSTFPFGPPAEHARDRAIALHARSLGVDHPFRPERIELIAPVPPWWDEA